MEPLKLKPAIQDYIWGGTRLRDEFGKESDLERLAESWELSCHPAGQAVIMNSVNKGLTLKEYLEQDWIARVGEGSARFSTFPVLIKLIDADQDLSVQVHPDDRYAREHENGENGKTECWYIVDCEEGAALAYGLNRELTTQTNETTTVEDNNNSYLYGDSEDSNEKNGTTSSTTASNEKFHINGNQIYI